MQGNYSTYRINSSTRNLKKYYNYKAHPMQADTRHPPVTVSHASKHSTWQKPSQGDQGNPIKTPRSSSNSTYRNSIVSGRQHPHRPYKIPQAHFYRILQGEIGFFSKGLSIALSCNTNVSVSKNSLSSSNSVSNNSSHRIQFY